MLTPADFMHRLLGTTALTARQWGLGVAAALVLVLVWEAAKWIARRRSQRLTEPTPAPPVPSPRPPTR